MNQLQTEIDVLIRARYPILYVVSSEELRVQEMIQKVATDQQKALIEWSCTMGLVPSGTSLQSVRNRTAATKDPITAMDHVIDQVEPAIFLFKDLHPFLTRNHPAVIRRLKEIAQQLKNSHKTLVLVSPVMEIPVELEKEVTLITFPLPTRAELSELLDRITEEVRQYAEVQINLSAEGRERLLQAALGLTTGEAENIFAKIVVRDCQLSGDDVNEVLAEKQQIIRKSGLLEYHAADESFANVGGLGNLKQWLQKRSIAFSDDARRFGLPAPKGVLLLGVQGCGKSLCAKAVASLWQLPLLRFDIGRMFSGLVGSSEENMRRAIGVASSVAPAVLWVDEIDKALSGTHSSGSSDGGTTARVFGTFLTWLSEKTAPVFVVATANDVSQLPPELLRKGRLDEIFFVDLPSREERIEIAGIQLAKRARDMSQFDLPLLADASTNFSGAEIEQAVVSALYDAFSEKRELTTSHVLEAFQQTVPLATTMSEKVAELRNWAQGRARHASGGW